MNQKPNIAFIIPAYNEEGAVAQTIKEARKLLPEAKFIVCDNNSSDATASEALAAGAEVIFEARRGKGNAVRRLLTSVEADIYIMVDGDNTYNLSHLPRAVQIFCNQSFDLMTGNRRACSTSHMRRGHGIGNSLFTNALRKFLDVQTSDVFSGLRIMSRRLIQAFPLVSTEFEFETELSIFASRMRISQADFPTSVRQRVGTSSKLNTIKDGIRILLFIVKSVHREYPLKIYFPISMVLLLISAYVFIDLYIQFLNTGLVMRLPSLIVSCILFVAGALLMVTGIVLREISAIKYQARYMAFIQSNHS